MSHLFVVGAGNVGLITAVGLLRMGHDVTVADVDAERVQGLQRGIMPIFEPGLSEAMATARERAAVRFTASLEPPADCESSFVCVSTPTGPSGPLDTANVETAVSRLLGVVDPLHTIVVRSTLPLDGPARLRAVAGSGARASITTNPEFLREGSAIRDFERPNRVVVGWLDPQDRGAAEAVAAMYAPLEAPTVIADADSVALIKLLSNVFLGMKIAYANEVARIAEAIGADVGTVIAGVGLDDRIGTSFMQPGPGFGGSCLPEQALAIALETAALGVPTPLLSAIHPSNEQHQRAIVDRVAEQFGGSVAGRRIAVFGLAFKANTDDVRESPALAVAALLRDAGADVIGHDPRASSKARAADSKLRTADSPIEAADRADGIVVATEWEEYRSLDWKAIAGVMSGTVVYDTRAVVDVSAAQAAGLRVHTLGRPTLSPLVASH